MRAIIQRVSSASVAIHGAIHARIGHGLLVLVAVEDRDTTEDAGWLAGKIFRLRVFDDAAGIMNLCVADVQGDLLIVSQFTLYASTKKGNRPSYARSSRPEIAIPLYEDFVAQSAALLGRPVATGVFGAQMMVSLVNEGPVTIPMDSRAKE